MSNVASLELCEQLYGPEEWPIEYKDWGINLRPNVARTLWICGYKSDHNLDVTADNPTDAAVKLCLALFEQGVLHKEGET